MNEIRQSDYQAFVKAIKEKIHQAQYQAMKTVNKELIRLYWDIGKAILYKIFGICDSFISNTMLMKNSNHWLEKLTGAKMS